MNFTSDYYKNLESRIPSGKLRTRFAPSPTGYMHLGNLRTALYTYLLAKKAGGTFILRIEDTDQERFIEGALNLIYDTLKSAGLFYDEGPDVDGPAGPYIQSERREIYQAYAELLVERGNAYYCFCGKEVLDEQRNINKASRIPHKYDGRCSFLSNEEVTKKMTETLYVIRQKIPKQGKTFFDDLIFGRIEVENSTLDDPVLLKSDGLPTYNFANVVDDHLMGITHVMRGTEYLASTPKYIHLYEGFGWDIPVFIHVSPIMKDATQKLSKRHGDAYFNDFIEKGYLVDAILNYIALLGWSPGGEEEKFSLSELISVFDIKGISKDPSIFDYKNLNALNGSYIRAMSDEDFYKVALPYIKKGVKCEIDTVYTAGILKKRCDVLSEIPELLDFIDVMPNYNPKLFFNKKMKIDAALVKPTLQKIVPVLQNINDWTPENIGEEVDNLIRRLDLKTGMVLWPLRIALSGKEFTPGGGKEMCYLLGKEESINRINSAVKILDEYVEESDSTEPVAIVISETPDTPINTRESEEPPAPILHSNDEETSRVQIKRHLTDVKEIERIAALAKLDVKNEAEKLSIDIKPIMDILDKLVSLELPMDDCPLDMSLVNVFREDTGLRQKTREEALAEREKLLAIAPATEAGCISVPKILGKGE